jgi:hypothetical protein
MYAINKTFEASARQYTHTDKSFQPIADGLVQIGSATTDPNCNVNGDINSDNPLMSSTSQSLLYTSEKQDSPFSVFELRLV